MRIITNRLACGGALMLLPPAAIWLAQAESNQAGHRLDAEKIAAAAGTKAMTTPDGVVRIGWPRTDVAVKVDSVPLKPFAGLGSWAAFTPAPHGAMVMGDTVVFQDEMTPAMDAAFAGGLEVTALHNHMVGEQPAFYFTHFWGKGPSKELARGLKAALDAQAAAGKKAKDH